MKNVFKIVIPVLVLVIVYQVAVAGSDRVPVTDPAVQLPDRKGKRPPNIHRTQVYSAPTFPGITNEPALAHPVYISSISVTAVVGQ